MLDGDDVAQAARDDDVVEGGEESGIAQDVADLQQPSGALGGLHQPHAVGEAGGHRFLQQDVVAGLQCGDGGCGV